MQDIPKKKFWNSRCSDGIYILLFAAVFVFLFRRCSFGFAYTDESFYLTIPYRLCQGDGLFIHEWHLSQMSSVLIYPIMKIYLLLFPGTDGIILHFRWIYTIIWGISAMLIGIQMRRYSKPGAYVASLCVMIFAPFGIMALSYNSMGIILLLNACIVLLNARQSKWRPLLSGVLFSGAVLCCPYLVLLYGLFTLVAVILSGIRNNLKDILKQWLFFSLGCGAVFILFCAFVFSRCSISDIINAYPWIMKDPAHPNQSLLYKILRYAISVMAPTRMSRFILPITLIMSIVCRYVKKIKAAGFIIVCTGVFVLLLEFTVQNQVLNFLMLPIVLLGFYCAATTNDRTIQKIFCYIWMPGAIYSFIIHISSNQALYCISSALTVAAFASIVIIPLYLHEFIPEYSPAFRRIAVTAVSILFLFQLSSEMFLRYKLVFSDDDHPITEQTVMIHNGPESGIKMSVERADEYNKLMSDLEATNDLPADGSIRYLIADRSGRYSLSETIPYLFSDRKFAACSAWFSGVNDINMEKLQAYYEINPGKKPSIVVMDKQYDNTVFYQYFVSSGYVRSKETERTILLLDSDTDRIYKCQ